MRAVPCMKQCLFPCRSVLPAAQSDDIALLDQPQSQLTVIQESSSGSASSRSHAGTNSSSADTQPSSSATTAGGGGSSSHPSSLSSSAIVLSDLQELAVIGSGSSGVVKKVMHRPTQQVGTLGSPPSACCHPAQPRWVLSSPMCLA